MDFVTDFLAPVLTGMFVIGVIGCVLVIPVVAFRLFSVLFEPDKQNDE